MTEHAKRGPQLNPGVIRGAGGLSVRAGTRAGGNEDGADRNMEGLPERFRTKFVITESDCWEWTANKGAGGYGRYWIDGDTRQAHRVSYEWLVGPIPEGLELDHLCRNHCCVNPGHLDPVTHRENAWRGIRTQGAHHRAKTHCPSGHPYEPPNLRIYKNKRHCVACGRAQVQKYRAKKKTLKLSL